MSGDGSRVVGGGAEKDPDEGERHSSFNHVPLIIPNAVTFNKCIRFEFPNSQRELNNVSVHIV